MERREAQADDRPSIRRRIDCLPGSGMGMDMAHRSRASPEALASHVSLDADGCSAVELSWHGVVQVPGDRHWGIALVADVLRGSVKDEGLG